MIALDAFLPQILVRAQGCPEPIALDAIRQAAIEFCERTRLWRYTDTVTFDGNTEVATPDYSVLVEIEQARMDGRALTPVSMNYLNDVYPDQDWEALEAGFPKYITQKSDGAFMIVPAVTGQLKMTLILKPSNDAEELPDFLDQEYRRVIVDGALAEIMMIMNQPYSSPDLASVHSARFQQSIDSLMIKTLTGQQRAPVRTKLSTF